MTERERERQRQRETKTDTSRDTNRHRKINRQAKNVGMKPTVNKKDREVDKQLNGETMTGKDTDITRADVVLCDIEND